MYNFDQAWEAHISQALDRNRNRAVAVNTMELAAQAYQTAAQRKYDRIRAKRQQRRKFRRHLCIGAVAGIANLLTGIFLVTAGLLPTKMLVLPVLFLCWLFRLATIRR